VLVLEDLVLPHVPVPPLNWRMDGPMRVALKGPNGCGKSTLLKTILGEIAPVRVPVRFPSAALISTNICPGSIFRSRS
jgi:ATPase subunit of ABC transporter with duplicated ATPase domains